MQCGTELPTGPVSLRNRCQAGGSVYAFRGDLLLNPRMQIVLGPCFSDLVSCAWSSLGPPGRYRAARMIYAFNPRVQRPPSMPMGVRCLVDWQRSVPRNETILGRDNNLHEMTPQALTHSVCWVGHILGHTRTYPFVHI